jgi:ubiquinone/menaquinone biosynthesis C-methylase UbiE
MKARENRYLYHNEAGNEADIARLIDQHAAIVQSVGLFHPAFHPDGTEILLDIACGPGSWGLDVAFEYEDMSVIGLDNNESTISYAMARASSSVRDNISFEVHDVTTALPVKDASIDYVNIALANSFLFKEQWPSLLKECYRVLRPGGWLRSIEVLTIQTSSRAARDLWRYRAQASEKDGRRYFELAPHLFPLLQDAGLLATPLTIHPVDFSEYATFHKALSKDWYVSAQLLIPFIMKYGIAPQEELQRLIEEMQRDMMLPQFYALIFFTNIAAQKPE